MHRRKQIKEPTVVDKKHFIYLLIDLGKTNEHSPDSIILAYYISIKYMNHKNVSYTIELAHVSTLLSAKLYEDYGYKSMARG